MLINENININKLLNYLNLLNDDVVFYTAYSSLYHDQYLKKIEKTNQLLLVNGDDIRLKRIKADKKITFGYSKTNDFVLENVFFHAKGVSFDIYAYEKLYGHFNLAIFQKSILEDIFALICYLYEKEMNEREVKQLLENVSFSELFFEPKKSENQLFLYYHQIKDYRDLWQGISNEFHQNFSLVYQINQQNDIFEMIQQYLLNYPVVKNIYFYSDTLDELSITNYKGVEIQLFHNQENLLNELKMSNYSISLVIGNVKF